MRTPRHENLEERLLHRMLFFTDAVFAIVLTLLVLELKPPQIDAGPDWRGLANHLFSFAMSFAIIGVFWIAHMNTTRRLAHFDWLTLLANLLFLFPICLLPFISSWLGMGFNNPLTWGLYCALLVGSSAGNVVLVLVMSRGGGRLVDGGITGRERAYRVARAASPGLAFGVGLALVAAHQLRLAEYCWVLIGLNFWLAGLLFKPKDELEPAA